MSVIRLRFVGGKGFVSEAIRVGEYGFWATHVEAVLEDGSLLGAHFDGGVEIRPKGYDAADMIREIYIGLPATEDQAKAFYDFLRAQVGKPYDITAIAGLVAGRDWREEDSWYCSELDMVALEKCGWFTFPVAADAAKITPRDLLLIISGRVNITEISR